MYLKKITTDDKNVKNILAINYYIKHAIDFTVFQIWGLVENEDQVSLLTRTPNMLFLMMRVKP